MHLCHLPALTLVNAARVELGPWWGGEDYLDDLHRFYWFESGEGWLRRNGHTSVCRPGRLYCIPAQTRFSFGCSRKAVQRFAHFRGAFAGGVPLAMVASLRHAAPEPCSGLASVLLTRLAELEEDQGRNAAGLEAGSILLQMLTWLLHRTGELPGSAGEPSRFGPVLDYVEANLGGDLSIARLASVAHLHRTHFSKRFRETYGIAPAAYVRKRRIEAVMQLLRETDQTLAAIAAKAGFHDAFHLSKTFKQITGVTPRNFRRQSVELP